MSGADENDPMDNRDDQTIAAEYALGLLEGEELLAARGRLATDKDFAWRKEWWDNWFVPLTDDVAGAEPSAEVWDRIEARLTAAESAEVVSSPHATSNIAAAAEQAKRVRIMQRRYHAGLGALPASWNKTAV